MPRTKKAKNPLADAEKDGKLKTISTQTSIDDDSIEIARLQEQVRLLKIENEVLRIHTSKINIAANKAVNDIALRPLNSAVKEQTSPVSNEVKTRSEVTEQIVNPPRSTKKGIKGCSCKGNCSTKVCGCVKKDKKCAETCKCSDSLCENQAETSESAEDKENNETNTVVNKTPLKVANKDKRRRGLFSPNADHLFSPSDDKTSSSTSPENNSVMSSIRFGQTPFIESSHSVSEKNVETSPPTEYLDEISKKVGVHAAVQKKSNVAKDDGKIDDIIIKTEPPNTPAQNHNNDSSVNSIEQDAEICPFKPKRHLPRTPPHSLKNKESALNVPLPEMPINDGPSLTPDNLTFPPPLQATEPLDVKDPAIVLETSESVDWEQHQAQLVSCRKCNRKFMPQRIEKHEACCKKL